MARKIPAKTFHENAKHLCELHSRMWELFRQKPHSEEHHAACAEFHNQYEVLAFPGGLENAFEELSDNDQEAIETTICYLEADPWYFRSGYAKEKMIRRLKHCKLTSGQKKRLAHLLINAVQQIKHREYREYARLAKVVDLPGVTQAMLHCVQKNNPIIAERAKRVLMVVGSESK
jgi:hypothetical protein